MKLSDLMLDMATGDYNPYDIDIAVATGKINVSSAYFEAAYNIAEYPEDMDEEFIQEAVYESKTDIPTNPAGATAMACTSAKKTLDAFFDLIVATAKSVKSAAEKDLTVLRTIGRKLGVTTDSQSNFVTSFAVPLGKSIIDKSGSRKLSLSDSKFLKGRNAMKMATAYGKGMANFLAAYGISISNVFADPAIAAEFDKSYTTKKGEPTSLKAVGSYLSSGGSAINMDGQADRHFHYTNSVKMEDIRDLAIGLYVLIAVSTATISACGKGAKGSAMAKISEFCNDSSGNNRKISRAVENISVDAKKWTANLGNLTTNIKKTFTDSAYVLSESMK